MRTVTKAMTRSRRRLRACLACLVVVAALRASDAQIVINEIHYDPANKSSRSEFIELFNAGAGGEDLGGWYFADGVDWTFSPGTTIAPGEYLVVTQDPDAFEAAFTPVSGAIAYSVPAGTSGAQNFGGALGMDFIVEAPAVLTDLGVFDSGSDGLNRAITVQLWTRDDRGTPTVPNDDRAGAVIASLTFDRDDPGGLIRGSRFKELTTALELAPGAYTIVASGYGPGELLFNGGGGGAGSVDEAGGLLSFVGSSRWGNSTAAFPMNIDVHVHQYAAGTFIVSAVGAASPDPPVALGPWTGKLSNGGERVTLRNAVGEQVDRVRYDVGFPWPTDANGEGSSMELLHPSLDNDLGGSWRPSDRAPTPGRANSVFTENAPPQLRQVDHVPRAPGTGDDVVVSVKVTDPDGLGEIDVEYQLVDPGSYIRLTDAEYASDWTVLALGDDGRNGDEVAGDDVYSGTLPGALQEHRRLVRYRFRAVDTAGAETLAPYEDDPQPNFAYFVYDGVPAWSGADRPGVTPVVEYDADVMRSLPAFHMISRESDVTNAMFNRSFNTKVFRFLGTLVVGDEVYDHMRYRVRGENSTYVSGKNKWKLRFNRGHDFRGFGRLGDSWPERLRTLNFGTCASPWAPPNRGLAGMDEAISMRLFNLVGVPAPNLMPFQLRVIDAASEASPTSQYEGDLWGLYLAFENPSGDFLDAHDLPEGNLFRMAVSRSELQHQGPGMPGDLSDLRWFTSASTGYNRASPIQPLSWWREHVDVDRYYSLRAVVEAVNHSDLRDQFNSVLFVDPDTARWTMLPWDLDLLYEEFDRWGPDGVQTNTPLEQFRKCLGHGALRIEFQNRLRSLQDLLLNDDEGWRVVREYASYVEPMAAVDRAMWDYHPRAAGGHRGAFYQEVGRYLAGTGGAGAAGEIRRAIDPVGFEGMVRWVEDFIALGGFGGDQLAVLHADARIPEAPTVTATGTAGFPIDDLSFRTSSFDDPQGAGTFAAIQWRVGEVGRADPESLDAVNAYEVTPVWESDAFDEFAADVFVPATAVDMGRTYRVRARMQDSSQRWSHWSDPVEFTTSPPAVRIPEIADLRITEIHYDPLGGSEYEFIELQNKGDDRLDLRVVSFLAGIDFEFAGSDVEFLDPGEFVVVVRNLAFFAQRYDVASINVAGEYGDSRLDNSGERLALGWGPIRILDFRYRDDWHPETDGRGASLNIVDVDLPPERWGLRESWFPSSVEHGTPGRADPGSVQGGNVQPGDANLDGNVDLSDALTLLRVLFQGVGDIPCAGGRIDARGNLPLLDSNGDGGVDLSDAVHLLLYLFAGGDPHQSGAECIPLDGCPDACRGD